MQNVAIDMIIKLNPTNIYFCFILLVLYRKSTHLPTKQPIKRNIQEKVKIIITNIFRAKINEGGNSPNSKEFAKLRSFKFLEGNEHG